MIRKKKKKKYDGRFDGEKKVFDPLDMDIPVTNVIRFFFLNGIAY